MNLDIQHFKTLLEAEKSRLEKELQGIGQKDSSDGVTWQASQKEGEEVSDMDDVPSAIEAYGNNADIIAVLETELHEVDHALQKIEDGVYGICEVSNEPIELDRLEANPAARTSKAHMNQ
jgi:DnaK suppressor protein